MSRSCANPTLLGNTIYLPIEVENSSKVVTAPDGTPTAIIYALADLAAKSNPLTMTVGAVTGETGLYVAHYDSTGMAVGNYTALVSYALSSAARRDFVDFAIA